MFSWTEVVRFSQPLSVERADDRIVTYRPMSMLPVIVYDKREQCRRIVPMRWGFPHPNNYKIPQPIHARSETIDTISAFRGPFHEGQRGIVAMRTFNEGAELANGRTQQWTLNPGDGIPRGFAFVWRPFKIAELREPLLACAMITVPANDLIRQTVLPGVPDPRMPAILDDADWPVWLGEISAPLEDIKAVLRTRDGYGWRAAPEPRPRGSGPQRSSPPTIGSLF